MYLYMYMYVYIYIYIYPIDQNIYRILTKMKPPGCKTDLSYIDHTILQNMCLKDLYQEALKRALAYTY